MTVSGVLQHIWNNEGVPGLFRCAAAAVVLHMMLTRMFVQHMVATGSGARKYFEWQLDKPLPMRLE